MLLSLYVTDNLVLQSSQGSGLLGQSSGASQLRQDRGTLRSSHQDELIRQTGNFGYAVGVEEAINRDVADDAKCCCDCRSRMLKFEDTGHLMIASVHPICMRQQTGELCSRCKEKRRSKSRESKYYAKGQMRWLGDRCAVVMEPRVSNH